MTPLRNFSLKNRNTFGFDISAEYFVKTHSDDELCEALWWAASNRVPVLALGGGSNLVLTQAIKGLVIQQNNAEIQCVSETGNSVVLHASAAVGWHDVVRYCVEHEYYGIENLSLIPGSVGAAPIQNIGAYGVELADVLLSVDAIEVSTGRKAKLSREECRFGYRESVFKQEFKGKYVITGVSIELSKQKHFKLDYAALRHAVEALDVKSLDLQALSEAVCQIRNSKLPDPAKIGNAGSFFKNPVLSEQQITTLQNNWPELPFHKQADGLFKVPAAWMVEKSGWKGVQHKNVGVHRLQSIVLVNYGKGSGQEVMELAALIVEDVLKKFGVRLEIEPVVV